LISYNRKTQTIGNFFGIHDSEEKSPLLMSSNFSASIKAEDELKVLPFKEAFHEALLPRILRALLDVSYVVLICFIL